jgi:hypothetical protein
MPLVFFQWTYVKDIVYKSHVISLDELKLRKSYTANAGEHFEGNGVPLAHLACQ